MSRKSELHAASARKGTFHNLLYPVVLNDDLMMGGKRALLRGGALTAFFWWPSTFVCQVADCT